MPTRILIAVLAIAAFVLALATPSYAATIVLDGTSGSNVSASGLSTDGNLTVSLGFFSEYLVVGGGGAGGNGADSPNNRGGGGGGAGGLLTNVGGAMLQLNAENYAVTVGAGGATGGTNAAGLNGGNSSFAGNTAFGGGGGGGNSLTAPSQRAGKAGGSGGGGASSGSSAGGAGTVGQGNNGGAGNASSNGAGGGGGGAGQAGANGGGASVGGNGGNGLQNSITGTNVYYAGGGGGRRSSSGGLGGGGGSDGSGIGTAGTNGLGGGGGGGTGSTAANGGSGIVIVRYAGAQAGTGGTVTAGTGSAAGQTLHTFTTTGSSALDLSGLDLNTRLGVTLTGAITGGGDFVYDGPGRLTLTQNNTYTGTTTISAGTLALSGTGSIADSSQIVIGSGATFDITGVTGSFSLGANQTLSGTGTFLATGKTIVATGTLSPGNSPGTAIQDGGTLQLAADANYNWQVYDASGLAGTGYDTTSLINGATLDLSALSSVNPYNINLWSLEDIGPDVNGDAINFDNTQIYNWTLFSQDTSISGFSADLFAINVGANNGTSGFSNDLNGGTFTVSVGGVSNNSIMLNFIPVPEPSTLALLAAVGGLAGIGYSRRRSRRA